MQQPVNKFATSQTQDSSAWEVNEPEIMEMGQYLSSANAPDIEEDARLCITSGARDMILDCSQMTYATGAGMRTFLNIARMMQDAEGAIAVRGLRGQPRDIFLACGMDAMIPMDDTVAAPATVQIAKA